MEDSPEVVNNELDYNIVPKFQHTNLEEHNISRRESNSLDQPQATNTSTLLNNEQHTLAIALSPEEEQYQPEDDTNTFQTDSQLETEKEASNDSSSSRSASAAGAGAAAHHLTRHHLDEEVRGNAAIEKLGSTDLKSAEKMIRAMGQRELRAAFERVYGSQTASFNNNWLRRKLYEAIGLPPGRKSTRFGVAKATSKGVKKRRADETKQLMAQAEAHAAEALTELFHS